MVARHALPNLEPPRRLEDLGLTPLILEQALTRGLYAWVQCTPLDPITFPGSALWSGVNVGLRELLIPRGWQMRSDDNVPLTFSADGSVTITASSGTADTGLESGFPQKRSSGTKTDQMVLETRSTQMRLEQLLAQADIAPKHTAGTMHWFLLFYLDEKRQELRSELSLPKGMDGHRVIDWEHRFLLDPISISPVGQNEMLNDIADEPDIDFEVGKFA